MNSLFFYFSHSNIYNQIDKDSKKIWKFEKHKLIVEYEEMPLLPPPFIIILHLISLVKFMFRSIGTLVQSKNSFDYVDNSVSVKTNEGSELKPSSVILSLKALSRFENSDNNYSMNSKNATLIEKKMTKQVLESF